MIRSGWFRGTFFDSSMNALLRVTCRVRRACRIVPIAAALVACFLLQGPAIAYHDNYVIYEAAASLASITGIRMASSDDDVTVVAWRDANQMIRTRTFAGGGFEDVVEHGAGGEPDLIHTPAGFTLVFSSGNDLLIRSGDGITWSAPAYIPSMSGADPTYPNLGQGHPPAAEDLYLAWCEGTDLVLLSRRISDMWQAAETVYQAPGWAAVNRPRVEAYADDGHPRPRVYFAMGQGFNFVYVQEGAGGWSEQFPLYHGAFGAELSVVVDSNMLHTIAGLGPQPT